MERKQASEYPQELLDLFHEYQHGNITRREFFDRAAKFAAGGLTVTAIWESLKPNYAWAQQVPKDDMRITATYETIPSPGGNGSVKGYLARPARAAGKLPAVLVIHENRGINPYIEDVTRRLAVLDFVGYAPDGLTSVGGYPGDDEKAAAAFRTVDGAKRPRALEVRVGLGAVQHPTPTPRGGAAVRGTPLLLRIPGGDGPLGRPSRSVNGLDELCDSIGGEDWHLGIRLERLGAHIHDSRRMLTIEASVIGKDVPFTRSRQSPTRPRMRPGPVSPAYKPPSVSTRRDSSQTSSTRSSTRPHEVAYGNELITPAAAAAGGTQVRCRDRLGGLLRYYHRAA